jgi:hypothetical protein
MTASREKLYEEIWAEPITVVSKRYGVSDSFLVRICKRLNVPRPPMGYWAKLAAGKKSPKALLPDSKPGDEIEWSRNGMTERAPYPTPKAPENHQSKRIRQRKNRPSKHSLVTEAPQHFKDVRQTDNGYLKPTKRLLLDLIVSDKTLSRALDITNELFLLLEDFGHHVVIATQDRHFRRESFDEREQAQHGNRYSNLWGPGQPTVVFVGTVAIGLTIFETSEEVEFRYVNSEYIRVDELPNHKVKPHQLIHSWTTKRDTPSGRLCVQAYSPYTGTSWKHIWRETKSGDFPGQFLSIVKALEQEASNIVNLVQEAERRAKIRQDEWEAQWQKRRLEEDEKKRIQNIKDSKNELLSIIEAWDETKRIDEFFKDAQLRAQDLPENDRLTIEQRLMEARELLGTLDALERFKAWKSPINR